MLPIPILFSKEKSRNLVLYSCLFITVFHVFLSASKKVSFFFWWVIFFFFFLKWAGRYSNNCFYLFEQLYHRKLRIWSHLLKKSLMENIIFCAVRSQYDYYQQFINGTNGLGDPKLSLSSNHGFSKYFFYLTNWLIRFEVRQLLFETLLSGCSYFFCKTENNNCNFSMLNYILKV